MVHARRIALRIALVVAVLALGAGAAFAQGKTGAADASFRGPGVYLSWIKILAVWFVFLAWIKMVDWVNIDSQELNLKDLEPVHWNIRVFAPFFIAFAIFLLIPFFWIGLTLLVIAYAVPAIMYVSQRNHLVVESHRVLTPEHLRYWCVAHLNMLGMKLEEERRVAKERESKANLIGFGGADERTNNARLLLARQSPGFNVAREFFEDAMACRAMKVMLDFTRQRAAINIMVDGVWIPRGTREREVADPALESLKTLCGLNPQDRRSSQSGVFAAEYGAERHVAKFVSQGTPAGERAFIEFEETAARFKTFDDLGMRVKMQGQLRELLEARQGMFLFSSLPSLGLRSTMDVVLHSCDRFVRDFVALEEKNDRYRSVENIPLTTYNAAEGENPVAVLQRLLRTQPNVVVVRDIANLEIVNLLTEAAADKLVIASLRAKDCADVLMRILAMGVPPAMLAKAVTAVHSQRLVRKLCGACMEAYTPTTQILQQLGVPEGRVDVFYRPRQTKPDDGGERCSKCGGTGFVGRTAIFELLVVGDAVRKTLNAKPNLELLKVAARKDGMKSLQEEGILLVAKGVTSLPELMRVLK